MPKSEFLQLAHVLSKKHCFAGRFMSEKLDGQRAFWDGGCSRGLPKSQVPWANTARDQRFKEVQIATGLWTRYGNVIHAPKEFLDQLPPVCLDGELYCGRSGFQKMRSIVADLFPSEEWKVVKYLVLDSPPPSVVFSDRTINTTNFKKDLKGCMAFWLQGSSGVAYTKPNSAFYERLSFCRKWVEPGVAQVHEQELLPFQVDAAQARIDQEMERILRLGGEGLILKSQSALYTCDRSHDVLKVKPKNDAEGIVKGYVWGAPPDNSRTATGEAYGKLLGLMGSMIVEFGGKEFKLSGFTDEERRMVWRHNGACAYDEGLLHQGEIAKDDVENPLFKRGSQVTFTYRELSDDGIPKEARFFRARNDD